MADATAIETVRTVAELRRRIAPWRGGGGTVGLVPTMGALHDGHLSLVRLARAKADRTCVTLFVNPKQFAPNEDFSVYPRDEARDAALLADAGADLLFAPTVEEIYPQGFATRVTVAGLGDDLEGRFRQGFFTGVATVVTKLLVQSLPDVAVFGEKDYQQLLVIRRLVRDLDLPVAIAAGATVREADGLALSSRNAYLSADERRIAPALHRTLRTVAENTSAGRPPAETQAWARQALIDAGFAAVDYVAVRDAETLGAPARGRALRVLAAAHVGRTRLIDNVAV